MLINDDSVKWLKEYSQDKFDLIIIDPPYGVTDIFWDKNFAFTDSYWDILWSVSKDTAVVLIFGIEPYISSVRISHKKNYRYDWYWKKSNPTNYLNAKKQPLRNIEAISVFYRKQCRYYPQLVKKDPKLIRTSLRGAKPEIYMNSRHDSKAKRTIPKELGYPKNTLEFNSVCGKKKTSHPTEKPLDLISYFIKTYTQENDLVLDPFMGSGTTCLAAKNINRRFVGIEKELKYFEIAKQRLK